MRLDSSCMPTFPEWWNWGLSFTGHADLRVEQRGVTEVEVRAMLERATGFEASVGEGRFMIHTRRARFKSPNPTGDNSGPRPWQPWRGQPRPTDGP
jgi:hypothetical protein